MEIAAVLAQKPSELTEWSEEAIKCSKTPTECWKCAFAFSRARSSDVREHQLQSKTKVNVGWSLHLSQVFPCSLFSISRSAGVHSKFLKAWKVCEKSES